MKKGKDSKKVAKLRAEIEVLKARLKGSATLPSDILRFPELKAATNIPGQNKKISPAVKTETLTLPQLSYLKTDLTKTFALTFISLLFILLLKLVILPQQKLISQNVVSIIELAASTLGKIKR